MRGSLNDIHMLFNHVFPLNSVIIIKCLEKGQSYFIYLFIFRQLMVVLCSVRKAIFFHIVSYTDIVVYIEAIIAYCT